MADGPKKRRYRDPVLGIRVSPQAANKLKAEAIALGMTQSQYLEHLIWDRGVTHVDYYAQQAAIQSYMAAGVSLALAYELLPPERVATVRKQAVDAAKALFGETRGRCCQLNRALASRLGWTRFAKTGRGARCVPCPSSVTGSRPRSFAMLCGSISASR
ncbi:hypothetical protein ASD79_23040 [Caulobacter sp. Root655]|uniref:hypothetical protein n=1 Tax=Caulobacter sp. Root655 TaxID=1736578 RepID=UPI0006F63F90|nr:hypothetical protein [Caulobacter sp. Root655]KRA61113.1 hypothetical protein ASD79_23040 [Caulobacter sp. Root655]